METTCWTSGKAPSRQFDHSSARGPILMFDHILGPAVQGTTTNGDYLLDFRKGAFLAGAPVQPVILRYGRVRPHAGVRVLESLDLRAFESPVRARAVQQGCIR